jgi:isopenicillin N synthase-like dioxygenase
MSIPVIDLSRFFDGDTHDRRAVARKTDAMCREIGFLSVAGHGVPDDVINTLYTVSKAFFQQPVARKRMVRQPSPDIVRGYIGFAKGALAATRGEKTPPDLKESYSIGPEGREDATPRGPANIWPENGAAAWMAYYAEPRHDAPFCRGLGP